jgi:hypothetical protein
MCAWRIDKYLFEGIETDSRPWTNNEFLEYFKSFPNENIEIGEDLHLCVLDDPPIEREFDQVLGLGTSGIVVGFGDIAVKFIDLALDTSFVDKKNLYCSNTELMDTAYASYLNCGPDFKGYGKIVFSSVDARLKFFHTVESYLSKQNETLDRLKGRVMFGIAMERWDGSMQSICTGVSFSSVMRKIGWHTASKLLKKIQRFNRAGRIHMDLFHKNILVKYDPNAKEKNEEAIVDLCIADYSNCYSPIQWIDETRALQTKYLDYYTNNWLSFTGAVSIRSILHEIMNKPIGRTDWKLWLLKNPFNFDLSYALRIIWPFRDAFKIEWKNSLVLNRSLLPGNLPPNQDNCSIDVVHDGARAHRFLNGYTSLKECREVMKMPRNWWFLNSEGLFILPNNEADHFLMDCLPKAYRLQFGSISVKEWTGDLPDDMDDLYTK